MQSSLQAGIGFRIVSMLTKELLVLQTAEEFDFAELLRLESAGWLQLSPECHEVSWQHSFKNRELRHQHPHDLGTAAQEACCLVNLITPLPRSHLSETLDDRV